jgi:hypothetical protein
MIAWWMRNDDPNLADDFPAFGNGGDYYYYYY